MILYSQRDKRWAKALLGKSKTTTIGGYGCKLCSFTMMCVAMGVVSEDTTPLVMNEILKKGNAFFGKNGDLLDDSMAAKSVGLKFLGRFTDINKEPSQLYSIKEVDMSPAPGKQQHFVFRVGKTNVPKFIVDPWTGSKEIINKYPFVSYRIFALL